MRFPWNRPECALVVGFYQRPEIGSTVLKHLQNAGFRRSAALHCSADGEVQVEEHGASRGWGTFGAALIGLLTGILALGFSGVLARFETAAGFTLLLAACALGGALLGWLLLGWLHPRIDREEVATFKRTIVHNETLVMVEVSAGQTARVAAILRAVEADPPVTFAFHAPSNFELEPQTHLLRHDQPSSQRLAERAVRLAQSIATAPGVKGRGHPLLRRLRENERILKWADSSLTMSAEVHQAFALSAEWLLDNAYLIQGQVNDIRRSLPESYYEELPVIASGPQAGLPRVYRVATEIVAESDGALDAETIQTFLIAFQTVCPLNIGELWAAPLMLRLRLVECLRSLAIQIERLQRESEQADFWANRLITGVRRSPERLAELMAELVRQNPEPSPHFASELVAHLYDEESALPMVSGWLDRSLRAPVLEVVQQEHRRQSVQQASLANLITSCRRLTQIQWQELFESVSRADLELAKDPAGISPRVDFETRDRYRRAVEEISKWSGASELDVIGHALALAAAAEDEIERHVGYYLIDEGRALLERRTGCRAPLRERFRRRLRRDAEGLYFGNISLLTLATVIGAVVVAAALGGGGPALLVLGLLLLLPASDLAVQTVNYLVTRLLPPRILPKMSFKKDGIPDDCRTLVVVPMLLTTPEAIRNEVARLEIRYLGNKDPNLRFALLSDYADAPRQHMPEDPEYLEISANGIEALNRRHGAGRFFLFHRQREWCESEKRWMGWERKRGKLEQLNRFLMGESAPELDELLCAGDRDQLEGIRFVITLDADTQLLRDTARGMIETLAHPLNQARLSPDGSTVLRGYTIIQPGVSATLPSSTATWFSRIFADPRGIDPYTHASSDVYQDLTGEGSYHGKGIYDLEAFHRVLSGRFPQAHLLSHDLLEGAHVRVGLATDIELLDVFPSSYIASWNRQHRWTRGDWQIIDWLKTRVPAGDGGESPNPLSAFNRWKILDNLRRSLLAPSIFALLVAGWFASATPVFWSLIAAAILLRPVFGSLLGLVMEPFPAGGRFLRELKNNFMRSFLSAVFLLDHAALSLDAIARVAYRRLRSRELLLEWETAQDAHLRAKNEQRRFILRRLWIPGLSALLFVIASVTGSAAVAAAWPYLLLWAFFPVAVALINRPATSDRGGTLTAADRRMLRGTARRTWRYFDDFVGPQTHWLPPDNFQETHSREVFMRTSPTNIGLWMLSTVAANDFGYIPLDDVFARNLATLHTLSKLERYEGHLLNWYDIGKLEPLQPRYVSTVDSGNLLASLWALEGSCREMISRDVLCPAAISGLADTLDILREIPGPSPGHSYQQALLALEKLTSGTPMDLEDVIYRLRSIVRPVKALVEALPADGSDPRTYWAQQVQKQAGAWNAVIDKYLRPVEILASSPPQLMSLGELAHECRREALAATFSLRNIATVNIPRLAALLALQLHRDDPGVPDPVRNWLDELAVEVACARQNAEEQLAQVEEVVRRIQQLDQEMGLRFLYDDKRRIFAIGFQVAERQLDTSFYDLLASEARLTSLLAIARGDVPMEHWWALGRPFGSANGRLPLLSWSGTMFEYLMPVLLTRSYENSLLDRACRDAVHCQIAYGNQRGVPWGISESAFAALDRHHVYQYRAFGVPTLALKRGQERDLVVAPYASALALGVEPVAAIENLRRLAAMDGVKMVGDYGYYESIDYSRQSEPGGEAGICVHCYMVHHQGMSLLAFDNALHDGVMRKRFHSDPRIRSSEALLHEHIPSAISPTTGETREERPAPRVAPVAGAAAAPPHTPDTVTPKTQLLSNGAISVLVTNSGGGGLRWRDLDITRWRADTTLDPAGPACYIRDRADGALWSTMHQPVRAQARRYTWSFTPDKADFRRSNSRCDTFTEIVVSAEDDAEVRRVTLVNGSRQPCRLEVTSYAELALAPHRADRAHPAFNKLFIETEWLPQWQALLARRRPRSPQDQPVWVAHLMVLASPSVNPPQFETDRARFIGRGRSLKNPLAMERPLTGSTGSVLDPIFSLRREITIAPNERVQFALVTVVAESREAVIALVQRYSEFRVVNRAFVTAWTRAQLEMRRLHIRPGDAQLYQQLAAHILFPQAQLRPPPERLGRGTAGQRALWGQGISGDLPIVAVTIGNHRDLEVVRQVLTAHTFWHLRGLKVDLVLISEDPESYEAPLTAHLRRLAEAHAQLTGVNQPGGVFLCVASQIPQEDLNVILAAARAVLVAARGTLRQQLGAPAPLRPQPVQRAPGKQPPEEPSAPLPFMELQYFNGLGGFTRDGKEYAIYLGPGAQTPAPWVNVMANPGFGAMVSESGSGFTWCGNSQSHRLTHWSNDPVCDPPGCAIYIRDEDIGVFWSPTPLPIREIDAHRTRHGRGYTVCEHNSHAIEQELLTFVPVDAAGGLPVRIQRLRLRNASSRRRTLTVTSYAALVLGSDPEETRMHVVTRWDLQSRSLFARNSYEPEFSERITFSTSSPAPDSYTGDRAVFIGRNRSLREPAAMDHESLSGGAGGGLDPCAAVQKRVELEPGQEAEVIFLLGQGADTSQARALVEQFRDPGNVEAALQETRRWWDDLLGTIQVETPEPSANLLLNGWLLYQTLSCRIWGRSAFYQSGGAYGFRDQLQDVMSLTCSAPQIAREHILRAAARQFVEGDVQHWWHPEVGAGVRTRISDDLLWLPFVTAHYVRTTGDASVLDETAPFLEAKLLEEGEHESFSVPAISATQASLLEHCRRAIARAATSGPHGLPLIGGGDWNDGLNRVGIGGQGESVWLAWFQICVLKDFAELLELRNHSAEAGECRARAEDLARIIDAAAWGGEWYRRGYFDDGSPLGAKECEESRIDSLPQSWAMISGAGDRDRADAALRALDEYLVSEADRLILLFTPPFDRTEQDVGYIKGYPPGVRENGGQYTHAAAWVAQAFARQGDGDKAAALLRILNPIEHARNERDVKQYKVEPYVIAADVYALKDHMGRGGWTWYTGAAGWIYRVWLEDVLGFKLRGDSLIIDPVIPKDWPGFSLRYRHKNSWYEITIENPEHICRGVAVIEMDGVRIASGVIPLLDDAQPHAIRVFLGTANAHESAPGA